MHMPVQRQLIWWGVAALALLIAMWLLGQAVLPFILGAGIAYLLDPLADRLERAGLSRTMAVAVITLAAILLFVAVSLLIVPILVRQAVALIDTAPELFRQLQAFLTTHFPSIMVEGSPVRTVIDGESYLMVGEALDEGTLLLGASLAEVDAAVAETGTLLALAVPLAVAVVGLVVWAVAAQALSPVDRIRRQVDAIDADALDHRVAVRGTGDEVDLLAATMNRMLSRIEESYAAQQRFAGDASHELRSPLATMRQYAELAEAHPGATSTAEIADVVREQGARMQETLEGLLLLARLDERAVRASDAIDLDDLARAQVARLAGEGLVVDARSVEPVRLRGDARLLRRAVENLVDNARRHARDRIAVGVRAVDGTALVWVDDDGPGIPESERSRVFDRFVRLDEGRSRDAGGSGLGLAIVLEIVRVHGGSVRIDTAPLGGARVVIELPIRDS